MMEKPINECSHLNEDDLQCRRGGMFHYDHLLCPFYGWGTADVQRNCAGFDKP